MIVDQRMDVVVADRRLVDAGPMIGKRAAGGAPATTVGDTPELLDVHMHQLTRSLPLVSARGLPRCTDELAGQRIAVHQTRDGMARQDRAARARRAAPPRAD